MSPELTPAARAAGRGLVAAGALAAGAALGAIAERSLLRRSRASAEPDEGFGTLRGTEYDVIADDGTLLHVEIDEPDAEHDDGLTVVFAHGYALNLDSWHYQRRALRGRARLVFYDQRSHGRSARADFDTHHVDQLGRDLATVIDAVAPQGPLLLIGHSMGGMTVMALAEQHPELISARVRGVALIATTAGGLTSGGVLGLPPAFGQLFQRLAPPLAAAIARQKALVDRTRWSDSDLGLLLTRLYSFGSTAPDQAGRFVASMVSATPIDVVSEFLPALQEHDKMTALAALESTELLVIVGDSDRLTPRAHSDEIVRRLPGAEYVVIRDGGHMVTLEKHDEVDGLLLGLLDRVRRNIAAGRDVA